MTRLAGIDDPGVDWAGARVLVRADLNAPIEDGRVTDDARIRASVPTLEHLLAAGAGVAVCSHLGRPKGQRDEALSLKPCAERLGAADGPHRRAAAGLRRRRGRRPRRARWSPASS